MEMRAINLVGTHESESETIQLKIASSMSPSKARSYPKYERGNVKAIKCELSVTFLLE